MSEERDIVVHHGLVIDADTGEIIDVELPDVHGIDLADWVLERQSILESELLALEARKKALVDNMDLLIKAKKRSIEGLHFRFGAVLEGIARAVLGENPRTKTVRFPFGQVSFRVVRGKTEIIDMDAAVAWAEDEAPEIVTKEVSKTAVVAAWERLVSQPVAPPFIRREPDAERVYIRTNVRKEQDPE